MGRRTDTARPQGPVEATGSRFVDDYLGYLLGQANHALFKDFEAAVRAAGLGSLEWRVLATLSDQAPMPVGQLAQEVLSQQPTVTKLLQRLSAQGWVQLTDDPQDQRRTLVTATPTGQRAASALIAQARQQETTLLARWSASEAEAFKRHLQKLVNEPPHAAAARVVAPARGRDPVPPGSGG